MKLGGGHGGMGMIRMEYPPNIGQIRAAFKLTGAEIFAWDGIIYSPSSPTVSPALVEHEKVHFRQQRDVGGPEIWWDRYIADPAFRLEQEMEAHIVEYRAYSETHGRPQRRRYLEVLARRLASPMYGGVITKKAAKARIKRGVEV